MHKTYTRLAGAAVAAGIGLGTAGLAPLATAEPTPHAQTDRHLNDAQKRAFDDTVKKINDQVRGALGASISDARVDHKDGKDVLSWDVDTHKLRDILHMSDDNAVLATALPDGVDASTLRTDIDTVSLSDLARGDSAEGKAVVADLPSADQLADPKVRDAFIDAISKAADSGLWPEIKPLVDKAGGVDKFADQLLSARGISANDISSLSRSVGGDKAAPSVFIPFDKSTDKVTLSADITDGSFGDNTRDKVAKASTPLAFTVGDVTLLDGKIDPNLVSHVPADIRAIQIGNTTLGQVLKDVIASINDVLGDIRDNVGDNIGDRIGDGDSLIPTEGNSGSEDAEAILDRIREILNPENKPTPSTTESETETSTTESKKPTESESDDKDADKPAEPTDKKDEDKKPTKDEAREALAVLERYVNETEGKDKPADSTDKETESAQPSESKKETESATSSKPIESESTSPSKKSGIMDSIFGGGDSEGKSSDGSSNEPVDQPAGDTGVVNPAVNEASADNADAQSGGSAPAGGEEKSAPRDRSQDSVFADRQGSGADESAPQEENKDYNAAAEGSMPVTGASSATKWMLGGAVALILGGVGAIIALRRKEAQQS